MDSVARLCVLWAVMQSGAENRGLCIAFPEEPPFIIEPGLSLENYILSDTPSALLSGDNVADRVRLSVGSFSPDAVRPEQSSSAVRLVPVFIPSGKFFKSGKDLTVIIVDPKAAATTNKPQQSCSEERFLIEYTAPRILTEPTVQIKHNNDGFLRLKTGGVLSAEYSIIDEPINCSAGGGGGGGSGGGDSGGGGSDGKGLLDEGTEVDGVVTGLSIDGKMEHVNITLPGMKSTVPDELPVNATKQGKYLIKDKGVEAVFFEPLLSSSVLDTAANDKKVQFDSLKLYKECLAPLRTGKITIYPNTKQFTDIETLTSSMSVAGPGFEWLWKVLQNKHGLNSTLKKIIPETRDKSSFNKI